MAGRSPASILFDETGNPIGVVLDGAVYRLQTTGKVQNSSGTQIDPATEGTLSAINTKLVSGTDIGDVTVNNTSGAGAVNVQDGGNSITVDGTVTANAGTGPWPVTDNGGSLTVDGTVGISGTVPVSGPLTDAQLRASAVPVSDGGGSLTVDATSLPLPTGAATETTLSSINTKTPSLGQTTMAGSSPVAIASNQTAIPVTDNSGSLTVDGTVTANAGTGPWPVTDNGGSLTIDATSLPLPTGAATEATLALIKNTDGIKKITDPLPSGSNTIGAVTQPVASDPWHVDGKGTAGTPSGGVVSVQGVTGGTPLSVSMSSAASDPSFVVTAEGVVLGNNKSMVSLLNATGSTVVVRIREIYLTNVQIAPVTGTVAEFQLRRITGHSVGTDLTSTILAHDTNDTLNVNISARTNATVAGEGAVNIFRKLQSTDEWGVGAPDNEGFDAAVSRLLPVYKQNELCKAITLRATQGITIKCATNTTAGSFDITVLFTVGAS
jgi:hypothetical protein